MKLKSYALSDIGKIRDENQDEYLTDDHLSLYIVADGMGGLEKGKEAARYSVQTTANFIRRKLLLLQSSDHTTCDHADILKQAMLVAEAGFVEAVGTNSGSTIVAVLLAETKVTVANIGDSQAYLLRGGDLVKLTREHNLANLLVEDGKLDPQEAKNHPGAYQLTAYIGMQEQLPVFLAEYEPKTGDRLLICSDGLTAMLGEKKITSRLKAEHDLKQAARQLVHMANDAGGDDNITLVLVDVVKTN